MKKIAKKILGETLYKDLARRVISCKIRRSIRKMKSMNPIFTADIAVDFLMHRVAREIRPWQIYSEILGLARKQEEIRPKVVVEIGTADGGTLFLSAMLADPSATLISIDLQDGQFGGGYPTWKRPLYESLARENQQIILLQGDSHEPSMYDNLLKSLGGRKVDYLFIDGDHTYEGVRMDFEMYSPLVRSGGFIAFHDIVADRSEHPTHFVDRFWNEIKTGFTFHEFIHDPMQDKCGIGVIQVN
jgi:cephalosporin hydroxylase